MNTGKGPELMLRAFGVLKAAPALCYNVGQWFEKQPQCLYIKEA